MENFKAVEKAMKTKAYSKEGLSAAAKLDPKELAKSEACDFLSASVDELERQIETLEAEAESIQATLKKGKGQSSKAERIAEIETITERHKWHQGKLELIKRSLENGGVETKQVNDLEEMIKYYLTDNANDDFMEDEEMYDELNLQEDEENYGMNNDNDRVSSQDTQSIQDETPEPESRANNVASGKSKSVPEPAVSAARRPSTQIKSPLPALATLHTPSTVSNGTNSHMKPAAVPTRAPGEVLKYASAAAAAAASDKMGIAPLPPPPEALPAPSTSSNHPPLPSHRRPSVTASPNSVFSQPASVHQTPVTKPSVPATSHISDTPPSAKSPALSASSIPTTSRPILEQQDSRPGASRGSSGKAPAVPETSVSSKGIVLLNLMISFHKLTSPKLSSSKRTVSQMAPRALPWKIRMNQYSIYPPGLKTYCSHSREMHAELPSHLHNHLKECLHRLSTTSLISWMDYLRGITSQRIRPELHRIILKS